MAIATRRLRSEDEFELWLEGVTERADPFMAWLGVVFALLVGFELAVHVAPRTERALEWAAWAIWAVFALEFLAKAWLAPRRIRFLRRHWLEAAFLVVPTLRIFRSCGCSASGGPCPPPA